MRRQRIIDLLVLLGLTALGFALRTTNAADVLVGAGVVFPENDPYYHMRRVLEILRDWPHVPVFDAFLDHPYGGPIIWPPLFDLAIASASRAAGLGPADRPAVELLSALLVPLLGGATCVPVYLLARQIVGRTWGLLAAGLAVLVPAHLWYSRLGLVDHHVAVTFAQVAMLATFLRACRVLVDRPQGQVASLGRWIGWSLAATLCIVAGFLLWNGYLLLVAVLDLFLAVRMAVEPRDARTRIALLAAVSHAGAALLLVPWVAAAVAASHSPLSPLMLSYLHVVVLLGTGLAAAAVAALDQARPELRPAFGGALGLGGVAIVVIGAALALAEWLGPSVARGLAWIFATDPFMAAVSEVVPILRGADGRLDLVGPQLWMTRFFLVAPLLLVALARRAWRERAAGRGTTLLLVWSACLFLLTLGQRRFGESFAPALAILVAWALRAAHTGLVGWLTARGASSHAATALAGATVAAALWLGFSPYYGALLAEPQRLAALLHASRASSAREARAPDALRDSPGDAPDLRTHRAAVRFARVLAAAAERSPAHIGPAAGTEPPPFGVMNPWPLGHKLIYLAGIPAASTPFGGHARPEAFGDWSSFFLASDERAALAILERRRLRWVAADGDLATIGSAILARGENPRTYYDKDAAPDGGLVIRPRPPLIHTLYYRLTRLAGSAATVEGAGGTQESIPALEHLRLVLDSADDDASGAVKVYEVVAGAALSVTGPPGERIELSYDFVSDTGRERTWRRPLVLDESGHARSRLPYSSSRPDLGHTATYRIEGSSTQVELHVDEAAVVAGRPVEARLGEAAGGGKPSAHRPSEPPAGCDIVPVRLGD